MFRLTSWRLGGAVSRSAAAAVTTERGGKGMRANSTQGRSPSTSRRRAVKRNATPKAAHARSSSQGRSRGRPFRASSPNQSVKASTKPASPVKAKAAASTHDQEEDTKCVSARPAYMSEERERQVLQMAERMQAKDTTTEVPVASFAYEILKAHPSVRDMGLRERMDFLLKRWNRLSKSQKLDYVNDPLRGLL
ncbi:hypothetical protein JKF63_04902 [Porcisia hertigi]|uniref:Uncharacterized protein n=1 Tax=Porcisia hertigi TaxID=2761500 RepID=A0A836IHI3_9TRYP|nr:hypothetical protein JKF63_04902 [Porcisia hertigi]